MTTKYTILVLLTALPDWLKLNREERAAFMSRTILPVLDKYEDKIRVRWLDAEAFSSRCSDIALFETADLQRYYFLMEELRDTPFFSQPFSSWQT